MLPPDYMRIMTNRAVKVNNLAINTFKGYNGKKGVI